MRSGLLARAAALILAAGGLLVIPTGPASAHCTDHSQHPDLYDNGGMFWRDDGSQVHDFPHVECSVGHHEIFAGAGINVHCALQVPDTTNDWLFAEVPGGGDAVWVREGQLNVWGGELHVQKCAGDGGFVVITQNP